MEIKTDFNRLSDLSAKLKRLENDISDITLNITKLSNTTAQTTKYQNTERDIKRACDLVIASSNNVNKSMSVACDKINRQSKSVKQAIISYKETDKISKISQTKVLSMIGSNLGGIFGVATTILVGKIEDTLFKKVLNNNYIDYIRKNRENLQKFHMLYPTAFTFSLVDSVILTKLPPALLNQILKQREDRILLIRNIEKQYTQAINSRCENAKDKEGQIYNKLKDKIIVQNDSEGETNYYSPQDKEIHLDRKQDRIDERGAGEIYFHEVGHYIDDESSYNGNNFISENSNFKQAILKDSELFIKKYSYSQKNINKLLSSDPKIYEAVSDIIGGSSNNKYIGSYGHWDTKYWENQGALEKETFAHFYSNAMGGSLEERKKMKEIFPDAYSEYEKIIDEISVKI